MNYAELGCQIGELVNSKQIQYGDSFSHSGEIMKVLYPNGITPEQYGDALTVIRVIDKLFRIANGDQGGESAWTDIGGYSLLGAMKSRNYSAR